ncbi:MAG: trimethylamine methyltransferase family protein, partial [Nitrospinota bacterium]
PGGNFLTEEHTLNFFQKEYFTPKTFNRHSRPTWENEGKQDLNFRARERARALIKTHEVPPLEDVVIRELDSLSREAESAASQGRIRVR